MCLSVCLLAVSLVLAVFFRWMRGGFRCLMCLMGRAGWREGLLGLFWGDREFRLLGIVYRGRRCFEAAMYGDAIGLRGCCVVLEVALLRCNKTGVMLDWHARQAGS